MNDGKRKGREHRGSCPVPNLTEVFLYPYVQTNKVIACFPQTLAGSVTLGLSTETLALFLNIVSCLYTAGLIKPDSEKTKNGKD